MYVQPPAHGAPGAHGQAVAVLAMEEQEHALGPVREEPAVKGATLIHSSATPFPAQVSYLDDS